MDKSKPTITRRKLLASVGVAGVGGLLGGSFLSTQFTASPPEYTHYTYAISDGDGPQLRVSWYSTYNGAVRNTAPTGNSQQETAETGAIQYVDEYDVGVHGPLVTESNILPGDSGTIYIGLIAESADAAVKVLFTGGENNDGPVPITGGLADVIDCVLWYDTGLLGIGGCTGAMQPPAEGGRRLTLGEFGEKYGPDSDDTLWLEHGSSRCLSAGRQLCLGFRWHVDSSLANEWQGESTSFGLSFSAESCGGVFA